MIASLLLAAYVLGVALVLCGFVCHAAAHPGTSLDDVAERAARTAIVWPLIVPFRIARHAWHWRHHYPRAEYLP